ncbi:MAG: SPOR domain-containing protein [Tabrizicola sp.]
MARAGLRFTIIGLAAAGLLTGCVEGGGDAAGAGGVPFAAAPGGKKAGTRDVEAPEVFQATEKALWDGRPSLGGIWVAAPEVTNPERALIVNQATGQSVTGALFRRERENPGPRLQLSSDAAEALGILAGQPTEIRVIALRKEEVKASPAPAPATVAPPMATAKPGDAKRDDAKPGEAAAIASAALAAVDAGKPAGAAPAAAKAGAPAPASGAAAADATVAGAAVAGAAVAAADEAPKRKTWKERRAEAKAAREAKKRAAAEAKAAASAAEADAAMASGGAAAAGAAPTATAEAVAVAPIEAAPLDARKPEVVAGKPEAAGTRKVVGAAPAPAAKPAASADTAAAPAVASGRIRPIQVASFSKEENARRAAEALARIGLTATPQKSEKGGQAVWGVVVQGDEAVLKKIKAAGFADAYFLK